MLLHLKVDTKTKYDRLFPGSYCRDPGSPVGAIKSGKDYNEGDVVYYTCKNGLKLFQGSQSRTCLNNKTWSGEPPICVGKKIEALLYYN